VINPITVFILIIAALAAFSEITSRLKIIPVLYSRKLLHITVISLCAVSPFYIDDKTILIAIVAAFIVILFFAIRFDLLYVNKAKARSWGIVYFVIAFFILLILFYNNNKWLILIPMLIMAWSDAIAGIMGQTFARKKYKILSDEKSFVGNIAFFVTTICIFTFLEYFFHHKNILPSNWFNINIAERYLLYGIIAIMLTVLESMSSLGSDNFFVPLGGALLLHLFFIALVPVSLFSIGIAFLVSIAFAYFAYNKKSLSMDGAIAAFFMAFCIAAIGGFKWTIPIFVFFVAGTLLSKWNRHYKIKTDEKSKKPRDYIQVFANGGVALILILFYAIYKHEWIFILYAASISASTADTFASEIGIHSRSKVIDILSLKPLTKGVSGGVTLLGFVASALGSLLICFCVIILDTSVPVEYFWLVLLAGMLGSITDSIFGSALQAKYLDNKTNELSDIANIKTNNKLARGFKFVTNDLVNILSNIMATTIIYFLLMAIK
jgi:uncharacterized protein (TIGR00297 family)